MGRRKWNANSWHRQHSRMHGMRSMWGRGTAMFLAACLVGLAAGAVANGTGGGSGGEEDALAVCHATGSESNPVVELALPPAGAAAHESVHGDDVAADDVTTPATDADDGAADASEDENASDEAAEADEAAAPEDAPADADEAAGEEGSGNDSAEAAEEALPENASDLPSVLDLCSGDVAVDMVGRLDGDRLLYDVTVESLGPAEANHVTLTDALPPTTVDWAILAAPEDDCAIAQGELRCDFGDLRAGETRSVAVWTPRCPQDCGDDLVNRVIASAFNDVNDTNNVVEDLLVIPDCPEEEQAAPTDPEPTEPANDSEEAANESGNENTSVPPPRGDLAVGQRGVQDGFAVVLTLVARSLGPGDAENVSLAGTLPDVRRAWLLGGEDAESCTLEGRSLLCWFGDLPAGEQRSLTLRAYTDRIPCGEHLTSTLVGSADDDQDERNNHSSAGIEARPC